MDAKFNTNKRSPEFTMKIIFLILISVLCIEGISVSQDVEFGGQVRLRSVAQENFGLDSSGSPSMKNNYDFRQRSRLYAIGRYADIAGMFEIENNSRWGFRTNTPNTSTVSPDQQDETGELYINTLFIDFPVPLLSKITPMYARIGRQYFQLGRGLVIDIDSDDAPDPLDGARLYSPLTKRLGFNLMYVYKEARSDKSESAKKMYGGTIDIAVDRSHLLPEQFLHPYTFLQINKSSPDFTDNRMFSGIYAEGELPYFMNIFNIERIKYRLEYSHQYGSIDSSGGRSTNYNGSAFFFDFNIRRDFVGGLKFKLKGMYFVSTGDDPDTKEIELFRSSYQNFRPGELFGEEKIGSALIRSIYPDERFGRGGSNMQVMKGEIEFEYKDLSLSAEYFNYLANKVAQGVSNKIGSEIDLTLEYRFTTKLTSHIKLCRFTPGLFFGKNLKPANEVECEIKFNF